MSNNLTTGPVGGHLLRQGAPMTVGLIAIFSFEAVDLFFISMLGDKPLAAVSFTFPVIWLLVGIGIGFEAGASSCISRAIGKGNQHLAKRLTTDTVMFATGVGICLATTGVMTIQPVFRLLGATDELMPLIEDFMVIRYWVDPVEAALWTSLASIRARGNTLFEGKVITSAAVLNACLDPLFIFGLFGFPRLEIQGAAVASLLSNLTMLSLMLFYFGPRLKVYANPFVSIWEILDSWRHMLVIGVPAMVTNAIVPISNAIVVSMVAAYGIDAVAGFGIAMRIEPMALIPFYALSAVSSPFAGQNLGAGQFDRILEARNVVAKFCFGFGLLLVAVLFFAAGPVASLFSDSPEIRRVAVEYLWLVSISYGAYGLVMSACATFNGIGVPIPGLVLSVSRVIVVFLPLALVGRWLLELNGLFIAAALSNLILGVCAFLWLGRRVRHIKLQSTIAEPLTT
jgi:putative MATE family efflux protein